MVSDDPLPSENVQLRLRPNNWQQNRASSSTSWTQCRSAGHPNLLLVLARRISHRIDECRRTHHGTRRRLRPEDLHRLHPTQEPHARQQPPALDA
jgi:hypothetical protein